MPKEFGKSTELLAELIAKLGKLAECDSSWRFVRASRLIVNFDRAGYTAQALPFVANVVGRLKKLQESEEFQAFANACKPVLPVGNIDELRQSDYDYLKQILHILRSYPSELPKPPITPYNTSTTERTYLFDSITRETLANYFVPVGIQTNLARQIVLSNKDRGIMLNLRRQPDSPAPGQAAQFVIAEALFSLETLLSKELVEENTMPDSWNWTLLIETYYKFNCTFAAPSDALLGDIELQLSPRLSGLKT